MNQESRKWGCRNLGEAARHDRGEHRHRGGSTESLVDKEAILAALEIRPGQTVLDAGCGSGYMAREFSRQVGPAGTVYALDLDDSRIAALADDTQGTNIRPMVADITAPTALPASAFDVIYLSTVFHGFSSQQARGFEAEAKRLLAPRGKLAILEIAKRATPFGPPLERRFTPQEIRDALGLAALATVDVGECFYMQLLEADDRQTDVPDQECRTP